MRRLIYSGKLSLPFGFHSGGGRGTSGSDQPLRREPDGGVALAGTSLAGVLRSDLRRLAETALPPEKQCKKTPTCQCVVCQLMGPRAPSRRQEDGETALRASKLTVIGGATAKARVRLRDRVGLERRTRTAAEKRKYDLEIAEPGGEQPLELPFELRIEDPDDEEILLVESVLRRLAGGWLFVGGKSASGLGRAGLSELSRHDLDLGDRKTLVAHLLSDDPAAGAVTTTLVSSSEQRWAEGWELEPAEATADIPSGWAQLRLGLELDFPWGLLVNDPGEALAAGTDHAFLRLDDGRPVLAGSALRGALRSRAEQILRTLGGARAACATNTGEACHEGLQREIDGLKKQGKKLTHEGELARHCPACRIFGSARLASLLRITDFPALPGRRGARLPQEQVAIDRFTGGAAEGAKFDLEAAAGVTVAGEIHLELGAGRIDSWGLGLLALVLRDLLWGDVPLGLGSGRGLNEYRARLTSVERFWIRPPAALAGDGLGLETRAGWGRWSPSEASDSSDPQALAQEAGSDLQKRIESWVGELERHLRESPPSVRRGADVAEEPPKGEGR